MAQMRNNAGRQAAPKKQKLGLLILKCIFLLLVPYGYLMLCGLVFDYWLKWYFMTEFIFYSLLTLYVAAIAAVVFFIVRFCMSKRKGR